MADIAQLGFRVDSSQVRQATTDLDRMGTANKGASKATDDLTKAGKNNSFQMRQTAMQLSQVASQGAVTGNYLQALAIQLPDLALAFGPVAIIAGALAGSLAGPLISALSNSSRGVEELTDTVGMLASTFEEASDGSFKFSEELVRVAKISEEIARLKVASGIEEARRSILGVGEALASTYGDVRDTLSLTVDESERLSQAVSNAVQSRDINDYNALAGVLADLETKYQDATNAARRNLEELRAAGSSNIIESRRIQEASEEYVRLRGALDGIRGEFTGLIQTGAEAAQTFQRLTDAGADFDDLLNRSVTDLENLQTAIPRSGYTVADFFAEQNEELKREQLEREKIADAAQMTFSRMITADIVSQFTPEEAAAQRLGTTLREYQNLLDQKLISDEQYQEARIAAEERYYSRIEELRELDRNNQIGFNEGTLSAFGMMVGNLTEIAAMGGEEQFETWKRLAQAQAGISAAMGALSVIGDPTIPTPLKPFAIGTMLALAGAQIAQIEQQEYRAREYGGQVAPGTSYLVGERGPEMITIGNQGGVVTPNSQMGSGENNTVVLNISTGVQSTVRAEMMSLMPTIVRTAQQVSAAQSRRNRV